MAGSVAKAYVQVIPSAEGIKGKLSNVFNSEMPSAGQSAGGVFGSNLVGKIKGLVAAAGIGKLLAESISAGADLQQSLGGIKTLFKDSASTVIANAEKAYKTAGMSANQYMETVTGFSASLLQSLGGDTAAAAKYADRALIDMADNANKMGTSMESIQYAYQGFAKQNYTMLDNLKLGYGGTQAEMKRLIADAANLKDVQEKLGITVDANSMSFGNITNAISVMQDHMGIAGATADEAATTFTGSLASMKAAFSDLLANLSTGRDIGPALTALGETIFTFVQNNLLPMVGNIFAALPETLSSLLSMAIQGLNLVADNADAILQMGIDLVTGLGGAIISALPYLVEAAWNIVASLGEAILSTDWAQLGRDTISSLRGSLDLAAAEILGTDGNIVQSVIDAIGSKLPDLLKNGEVMVNQLVDGIFLALPGLVDSALKLCVSFISMLISNLPNILNTGKSILLNLVEGIYQSFPSLVVSASSAVISLISELLLHLPELIETGFELMASMLTGIVNAYPDIYAITEQVAKMIVETIKNTDWLQLGKDIVLGLIRGVGALNGALRNAAWSMARAALNAIKSALGIASPSKVMRDQVGKWIPPGIAVGIKANTKPLTEALHDMSALTTDSLQTDMNLTGTLTEMAQAPTKFHSGSGAGTTEPILERIYEVLCTLDERNAATRDSTVSTLREILEAILGIQISDGDIYQAVNRHRKKISIMSGNGGW